MKKEIAKVLVGSRLHGTYRPDSDYDYRGIYMSGITDKLSPFRKEKTTSWIEGNEDDTSYELAEFCKLATKGNATIWEVFKSDKIIETSAIHKEMQENWLKFMDTKNFVNASRGYAHNQWNKFFNRDDIGEMNQNRTAKFAISFLRVMWQCEQFLRTGEFYCNLENSDVIDLIKSIKGLSAEELAPQAPEIYRKMDELERRVYEAWSTTEYKDLKPDIPYIEDFIVRSYQESWTFDELDELFGKGKR